ncbi:MAG: formylglycine-generating enzyme family protein, partial [Planctomycetota bacterium]
FYKNSANTTHPVGGKSPNAFGLYDMHGNVWQWCADGVRDYSVMKQADPSGAMNGDEARVLRGGSWDYSPNRCRSAYRDGTTPGARSLNFGFRIVLPLDF